MPLQYAPDTLRQFNRTGLSNFRIAPLPPNSIPTINSTSQGVTQNITNETVNQVVSSLTFLPMPHEFLTGITVSGVTAAQPAFTDVSGVAAPSQLPNPTASTLGGVESKAVVSHNFLTGISTLGVPSQAQPDFTDLSGTLALSQIGATGTPNSSTFLRGDYSWATPSGSGGFPSIVYNTPPSPTNTNISAFTMVTVGASDATYRYGAYVNQTALGSGCSGNTNATFNVIFTDPNNGTPVTLPVSIPTIINNGTLGVLMVDFTPVMLRAATGTVIQYSMMYSIGSGCSIGPTLQMFPILEQLTAT